MLSLKIPYSYRQITIITILQAARLGDQPEITWKLGIYVGTEPRTPDSEEP